MTFKPRSLARSFLTSIFKIEYLLSVNHCRQREEKKKFIVIESLGQLQFIG